MSQDIHVIDNAHTGGRINALGYLRPFSFLTQQN